jgi:hypothetical protein
LQPGEYRVYLNRNVNNSTVTSVRNVAVGGNAFNARVYPNPVVGSYSLEVKMPRTNHVNVT